MSIVKLTDPLVGQSKQSINVADVLINDSVVLKNTTTNSVAVGKQALQAVTTGIENVAVGYQALQNILTGNINTCVGSLAGSAYTGAEIGNICIGSAVAGTAGESNKIRIGSNSATACFIQGIYNNADLAGGRGQYVLADGTLTCLSSSARYKDDIKDLEDPMEKFMKLRPVEFTYKRDVKKEKQYGLLAEECEDVMPELVIYDAEKRPDAVSYQKLDGVLVKVIQQLKREIDELKKLPVEPQPAETYKVKLEEQLKKEADDKEKHIQELDKMKKENDVKDKVEALEKSYLLSVKKADVSRVKRGLKK